MPHIGQLHLGFGTTGLGAAWPELESQVQAGSSCRSGAKLLLQWGKA